MGTVGLVAALQALPFHPYDDLAAGSRSTPPTTHGLYAWWQTAGAVPGIAGTPHPSDPSIELLYVGTAPKDATSNSNLRQRLANHHRARFPRARSVARQHDRAACRNALQSELSEPDSNISAPPDPQAGHLNHHTVARGAHPRFCLHSEVCLTPRRE
jgi:hypothetical protein